MISWRLPFVTARNPLCGTTKRPRWIATTATARFAHLTMTG